MRNFKVLICSIILVVLSISWIFGQIGEPNLPIDSDTKKITYTEVVLVDSSTTKQELYSKAREWFAKTYVSSTNVLQMEDKENGKLIGKALMEVSFKTILGTNFPGGFINYTISIYLKDGKYKYEFTNFHHTGTIAYNGQKVPDGGDCESIILKKKGLTGNSYKNTYQSFFIQMDENIKVLIESLKSAMVKNSKQKINDNW